MTGTGEGIARYCEELVRHLAEIDFKNEYFLLLHERANSKLKIQNPKFRKVIIKSKYYSWAEQTRLVWELQRLKLDLVHFPSFNVPILFPGKFVVTIHDIIHHLYPGKKKSRWFHRLAYRLTIKNAVNRAAKIVAVSETTKTDILKTFGVKSNKVEVISEGVDEKFSRKLPDTQIQKIKNKYGITKPYLLFVGVWRQYKNLQRLAQAFDLLKERYHKDLMLGLVGKIDLFYPEIKNQVMSAKQAADIIPLDYVEEEDLLALYQGASVFILPSLTEGFGLVTIEAQCSGIPVAVSDISVLREIAGEGAAYFNPLDPKDIAEKIQLVLEDQAYSRRLIELGLRNSKKYVWSATANNTLAVYQSL